MIPEGIDTRTTTQETDITTIPGLLNKRADETPNATAQWVLDAEGKWQPTTWAEYRKTVCSLAGALKILGLHLGQHVGIMAQTSQTWDLLQLAILMSGGVVVGMDPHDLPENINSIAARSKLSCLVVQNSAVLQKISDSVLNQIQFVIIIDTDGVESKDLRVVPFNKLLGQPPSPADHMDLPGENSPATIIFTSGTTGEPKGILYTHQQVLLACRAITETYGHIKEGSRLVCWLPLSNLFQRIINFCAIGIGAETYYVTDPRKIMQYLPQISPHVFTAVPRFFEKLHEGILAGLNKQPRFVQRIFDIAFRIGMAHAAIQRGEKAASLFNRIVYPLADRLVLKSIRRALGGSVQFMISGSAPMPKWLLEWFHAAGLLILEAYGISENIIPNAANSPDDFKFGTVGKPLPGNEIRFSEDGELLVRGAGVFKGYHADAAPSPLTSDGFLTTGDYAAIDPDGFVTLTGRKSDIFKTSTGRRIAPNDIEERIRTLPYVEHAVIFGAGRKYLTAIISISMPKLCETAPATTDLSEELRKAICKDIFHRMESLPPYKQPAGLLVTTEPFTVEGKELTGNLKVRRKSIETKYLSRLDDLYKEIDMRQPAEKADERILVRDL